eukprot:1139920-Pelagomonas_calceolata.AAC.3
MDLPSFSEKESACRASLSLNFVVGRVLSATCQILAVLNSYALLSSWARGPAMLGVHASAPFRCKKHYTACLLLHRI